VPQAANSHLGLLLPGLSMQDPPELEELDEDALDDDDENAWEALGDFEDYEEE
jgi:hypothetical protein